MKRFAEFRSYLTLSFLQKNAVYRFNSRRLGRFKEVPLRGECRKAAQHREGAAAAGAGNRDNDAVGPTEAMFILTPS